jgi:1-acyl-sn-glycerol-3-phosphate acyltransferase
MGALYSFGSGVVEYAIRAAGVDWRVDGLEHLPREGPAIVASNHVSYLDFAFVMLSAPRPRREMRFLARADLFDGRFLGWFLRGVGQIPVDRDRDPLGALRNARACLDRGELVGVHPEGTISPSFVPRERAATGTVRLAEAADVDIVPCAVWGSQRLLTKWRPARIPPRGIPVRVRYGAPGASDAEVRHAFDELGLTGWLGSLDAGLATRVGERGQRLSAGERQLVAIARAWIVGPDLLVLDEATSAVDPALEVDLRRAIEVLTTRRTSITVAHRLSTAESADRVLVFEAGRLVDDGPHARLLERPDGVYGRLHADWAANTSGCGPDAAPA